MCQCYNIAIDAMGGDNAPGAIVEGCVNAIKDNKKTVITLIGDKEVIETELSKYQYNKECINVVHCSETISNHDSPVVAIRKKKDSSIVIGMNMVKNGECSAFVSAGSTGALLAGGTFIIGRINGIERPALAPLIPTKKGYSLLLDVGANADCKPNYLVQFAKMGYIYTQGVLGKSNPKVGIINIGTEEGKGNTLTKETYKLLEEEKANLNFVGNIEARDITDGEADVLVCDGFTGNVILKNMEGVGKFMFSIIRQDIYSSLRYKIGGALLKPVFKNIYKRFDASEVGGAALLGLKGLVVKAHGNSDAKAIVGAIKQAERFIENDINKLITDNL